ENNTLSIDRNPLASIGAYANGTILYEVIFEKQNPKIINLRFIHPNGTLNPINPIKIPCNLCDYRTFLLLNPNYVLIIYDEINGISVDWTRNTINKYKFGEIYNLTTKITTSENNDSLLVARLKNKTSNQLLCTEYIINDRQIISRMSKNLTFKYHGKEIKNIVDFNLDGEWKIAFRSKNENPNPGNYDTFFSELQNKPSKLDDVFGVNQMTTENNKNDLIGNNIFILPNSIRMIQTMLRYNRYNTFIFISKDLSTVMPKYNTNEGYMLRQEILCANPHCMISENFTSFTISLSNITFNIPNTSYYVEIPDNFVKYKEENLSILGIKLGNYDHSAGDDIDFMLKLTDVHEQNNFFEQMRIELSKSIPVDDSRISKVDSNYEEIQIYF
ncbi:hypothetical protein C1645_811494, partial [Glomus cerebriforme]